jgi:hypothetical protein
LLRTSLALSSTGTKPARRAHRCADVVLPMPGGPETSTPRNVPIKCVPGFLKLHLTEAGLRARGGGASAERSAALEAARTHQSRSHSSSFSTLPLLPQISLSVRGA